MEGLEVSEIKYIDLLNHTISLRIDSEYFKQEYLLGDRLLKYKTCEKLVDVTRRIDVGFVGSMTSYYREVGVTLLQTKNISSFFVSDSDTIKITEEFHNGLQKSQINFKDILIARSGSFGKASIYLEKETINSSDIIIIEAKEKAINPFYLTVFLNSKSGVDQMIRFASGGLQGHVNLTIIEELQVPILENWFQKKVEEILWKSYLIKKESQDKYSSAETLLLETLGLSNFEPSAEPVNVKGYKESFLTTGRLDAEYYQKKYDFLENHLDSFERKRIGDFIKYPVSSGITPKAGGDDYTDSESGIPFVRAVDLQNGEVSVNNFIYIKPEIHNGVLKRTQLKNGDVLFSIAGTVGRCALFNHQFEANINQAVSILRFDDSCIKRLYLIVFFNSEIGKEFVSKYSRQGLQTNLNLAEVADLRIPIIDYSTQEQIAALVEESFHLKKQSERLLETAKRAVEIAIEQDEDAAMRYIEEQSK